MSRSIFSVKATGPLSGTFWSYNFELPKGTTGVVGYSVYDDTKSDDNELDFELFLNDNRDHLAGCVCSSSTLPPAFEPCCIMIDDKANHQLIVRGIMSVKINLLLETQS